MAKAKQEIIEHEAVQDDFEKQTSVQAKTASNTTMLAFVFIAIIIALAAGAFSFILFQQLQQNEAQLNAIKVEIGGQLNGKLDGVSGKFNHVTDRFTNVSDRISRFNDEVSKLNNTIKQQNTDFNQKFNQLDGNVNQQLQQQSSNIKSQQNVIAGIGSGLKKSLQAQEISNEQIIGSIDKLYKQKGRTRNDWILSEVEYLLLIANHGLQLSSDVNTAIIALESADTRLLDMGDPGIINIRKSIADELIKLKAVPIIDVAGMQVTLSGMIRHADSLAVLNSEIPSVADLLEPAVQATSVTPSKLNSSPPAVSQPIPQSAEYYKAIVIKATDKFLQELKNLVVYRNKKVAATALVAPQQKFFLKQHVALKMESARKALLDGKNDLFHSLLEETQSLLNKYFDSSKQSVKSFQTQLASLQTQNLSRDLPDISFSLQQLKKYVAELDVKRSADKSVKAGD